MSPAQTVEVGYKMDGPFFELFARLVAANSKPADAFARALEALQVFHDKSLALIADDLGPGQRTAQLEEWAWERFQKVKATAAALESQVADVGRAQLEQSVAAAEANWLAFGTFRLREALGQYKPKEPKAV